MGRVDNLTPHRGQHHRPGNGTSTHRDRANRVFDLPVRVRSPFRHPDGNGNERRTTIRTEGLSDRAVRGDPVRPLPRRYPQQGLVRELDEALAALDRRRDEIGRLQNAQHTLKLRLADTEKELHRNDVLEEHSRHLKKTCASQAKAIGEHQRQAARQEEQIAKHKEEIAILRTENEDQKTLIQSAYQIRQNDQATLADLRQSIDTLTNQVSERNDTIRGMNELVLTSSRTTAPQEALDLALEAQASTTLNMVSDLQAAAEMAEQQAAQQQADFTSRVKELECKIRAQASIIERVKAAEITNARLHDASQQRLNETQTKLHETQKQLIAIKKDLEAKDKRLLNALNRNDSYKRTMDQFRDLAAGK